MANVGFIIFDYMVTGDQNKKPTVYDLQEEEFDKLLTEKLDNEIAALYFRLSDKKLYVIFEECYPLQLDGICDEDFVYIGIVNDNVFD